MNERLKKKIKGSISGSGASLENDNKRRETLGGGIEKFRRMQHLMVFVQTSACCGFTPGGGGAWRRQSAARLLLRCSGLATFVLNITTKFHPFTGKKTKQNMYCM